MEPGVHMTATTPCFPVPPWTEPGSSAQAWNGQLDQRQLVQGEIQECYVL